ncbi:MAG: glycoside hydrolase family 127 protein, partial [Clostridiales bacterium]|nr:glycoside hydrolase family 127 protein [Clostridiales bacterium]
MHKILSGLVAVYLLTGYAPALHVAEELGDWVYRRVSRWNGQVREQVLSVEYGGMNACLYALYEVTGKEEYAVTAHVFDEETLFDAILSEKKDVLRDKHANTTIPKIIGALKRYEVLHGRMIAGERVDASRYLAVAKVFFKTVVERHTYATGGNSEWEHFGADYVLDHERTNCNCETCNVYNMLKLARSLFCITGDRCYADYYDNAFTNTILSSQNPETGMTTYFQPMASGYFKCFSRPYDNFWCCTGSGMENFTKLGEGVLYRGENGLYLERYISADYCSEEIALSVESDFPLRDSAEIMVRSCKQPFTLFLRVPDWCAGEPALTKNGVLCKPAFADGHVRIEVKAGDRISLQIPVNIMLDTLPDGDAVAFRYGGALLSA